MDYLQLDTLRLKTEVKHILFFSFVKLLFSWWNDDWQ